jgi:hypothetical protein
VFDNDDEDDDEYDDDDDEESWADAWGREVVMDGEPYFLVESLYQNSKMFLF